MVSEPGCTDLFSDVPYTLSTKLLGLVTRSILSLLSEGNGLFIICFDPTLCYSFDVDS